MTQTGRNHARRMAVFTDPDGNPVGLLSP